MKIKTKAWINLGLLLFTLVVNGLGATGLINGASQAEVSDTYHTLITPAGHTFSIWSVIYGLLIIATIVMIAKQKDGYYHQAIEAITPWFWLSSAFNMIWIVSFSYYRIGLSTLFIAGYLFSLVIIVKKLAAIHEPKRWLLPLTFGLNTGWLFLATVVNIAAYLVQIEWTGFGMSDHFWAILILCASAILAGGVAWFLKNAAFTLPIAWAYIGINRELSVTVGSSLLKIMTIIGVIVLLIIAVYIFIHNKYALYPNKTDISAKF